MSLVPAFISCYVKVLWNEAFMWLSLLHRYNSLQLWDSMTHLLMLVSKHRHEEEDPPRGSKCSVVWVFFPTTIAVWKFQLLVLLCFCLTPSQNSHPWMLIIISCRTDIIRDAKFLKSDYLEAIKSNCSEKDDILGKGANNQSSPPPPSLLYIFNMVL